jgi:hypothetical protein
VDETKVIANPVGKFIYNHLTMTPIVISLKAKNRHALIASKSFKLIHGRNRRWHCKENTEPDATFVSSTIPKWITIIFRIP